MSTLSITQFATISDAITTIGSAKVTLILSREESISGTVTLPDNISLRVEGSGKFTKTSTALLTIGRMVGSPTHQIFSGFLEGEVVFGNNAVKYVMPEWWGAVADGADCIQAINCAKSSQVDAVQVRFGRGVYNFTGPIQLSSNTNGAELRGTGYAVHGINIGTRLHNLGGAGSDAIQLTNGFKKSVKHMQITGSSASRHGINTDGCLYVQLEHIIVGNYAESAGLGHGSHGIRMSNGCYNSTLRNVRSMSNFGDGINITGGTNAVWMSHVMVANNALNGVYVNDSYQVNGTDIDINSNGWGSPHVGGTPGGGDNGTSGIGLVIVGTSHSCHFKNVNYEVNGYTNTVYIDGSGDWCGSTFKGFVGNDTRFDIRRNGVTVEDLMGPNTRITFNTGANFGRVLGKTADTTVTNDGGSQNIVIDGNSCRHYDSATPSATTLILGDGRVFKITGNTTITSIQSADTIAGREIILIFSDILTFTDGNNLKLAGNFVTAANATLSLVCDGTDWFETGRSTN